MVELPGGGAKHTIVAHEGWVVLFVRPSVAPSVQVDIMETMVRDETSESVHQALCTAAGYPENLHCLLHAKAIAALKTLQVAINLGMANVILETDL